MEYTNIFNSYWQDRFSHSSLDNLVEQERLLSKLIDDDSFSGFLMMDEIMSLYELVRDECISRLARYVGCCRDGFEH